MGPYSGHFELQRPSRGASETGPATVSFDEESFTMVADTGVALTVDLGDIDALVPGDLELGLRLAGGDALTLRRFGKSFPNLSQELLASWRDRLAKCLLVEDLNEVMRAEAHAQLESAELRVSGPAEIRLYRTNLAVLPLGATGFQWRLSEVDFVDFDEATYTLGLRSGPDRLILTKLGKRTAEFRMRLAEAMEGLASSTAAAVRQLFPFLAPDAARQACGLLKEGRAASRAALRSIDTRIPASVESWAADDDLRPYFERIRNLSGSGEYFTGFKFVRPEPEDNEGEEQSILRWFYFPIGDRLAWEATTLGGRATYLFRVEGALETAVQRINRALLVLNFRREPIYLPDDALESDPRYRRHAIACRKIPALRRLRELFAGRVAHTTPESWESRMKELLSAPSP